MAKQICYKNYDTLKCFKTLAACLVPAIAIPRKLDFWPGMSLVTGGFQAEDLSSSEALDGYLIKALQSFLTSFSLQIQVLEQDVANGVGRIGRAMVDIGEEEVRSRRKRVNNAILLGGLLSAGTMLALIMAGISAMAGKALVMSLVSSGMVMMMNKNNGNGGGNGGANYPRTSYEIIHTIPHEDDGHRHWLDSGEGYRIIKAH
ncbi:uncharacterized protein [Halyomorpha halys]|uniref:uncharacterized protein isoform X2 n=1 Tax=Halyomorpha halys TaxID=286706 RepID=UPI0006D51399|nr:uncharacterized protein LOC106691822 isoform X2 [Halyomorpha halys]